MTDREVTYRAMTPQVRQKLKNPRPGWKPVAPRLVPAHEQVIKLPGAFDTSEAPLSSASNQGCTAAKARAKDAGVAAKRVVESRRTPQPTHYRPTLARAAGYQKLELTELRDKNLMPALESLARWAAPVAAQRADAQVTATRLKALAAATTTYRPLLGTPCGQVAAGSMVRTTARMVGQQRAAFEPSNARLDSLGKEADFAGLGAECKQAHAIVMPATSPASLLPTRKQLLAVPAPPRLPAGLGELRRQGHIA